MTYKRRHHPLRLFITLLVAAIVVVLWRLKHHQLVSSTMSNNALSHLAVSIRKSAPNTLTFSVTNRADTPITLLRWESPLDPMAIKLGKVRLFAPADSTDALDIPIILVRRKMPPGQDSLVTIEPGETSENAIELKEPLVPVDRLQGDVKVSYQGRWVSAWRKRADEITHKDLEDLNAGDGALEGDCSVEPVIVNF